MNGSAGTCPLRCFQILIGSVDLDALKIPAPKGGILTNGERRLSRVENHRLPAGLACWEFTGSIR